MTSRGERRALMAAAACAATAGAVFGVRAWTRARTAAIPATGYRYYVSKEPVYAAENPDWQRWVNYKTDISGFVPNWVTEPGAYERLHPGQTLGVGEVVEVQVNMHERPDYESRVVDRLDVNMFGPDEWDFPPDGLGEDVDREGGR